MTASLSKDARSQRSSARRQLSGLGPRSRKRGAADAAIPDDGAERQRWAGVMALDHQMLRGILDQFKRSKQLDAQHSLLRLALDFHGMHAAFEEVWMHVPELDRARLALNRLEEQLELTDPGSSLYRPRGVDWALHLNQLMDQEEGFHRQSAPRPTSATSWSTNLLERRMSLVAKARCVLQSGPN